MCTLMQKEVHSDHTSLRFFNFFGQTTQAYAFTLYIVAINHWKVF